MKVLVIGFTTDKGQKVSEFLINRGAVVFVADNRVGQSVREIKGISRIFTLNPRHRDSMWLMLEMSKPDVLIYCASNGNTLYGDYSVFLNALLVAAKAGVSKIVLIINKEIKDMPITIAEVETIAMRHTIRIVAGEKVFEWMVVYPQENLLKQVKRFLFSTV